MVYLSHSVASLAVDTTHQNNSPPKTLTPDIRTENKLLVAWPESKPQLYMENGVIKGAYAIDCKLLMAEAGLAYTSKMYPQISRLTFELNSEGGKIDMWLSSFRADLQTLGTPVVPTVFAPLSMYLFSLSEKKLPPLQQLKTPLLITVKGYKYAGTLDRLKQHNPHMQFVPAPTHKAAFQMLQGRRAEYVLDYYAPALHAIKALRFDNVVHKHYADFPIYMYVAAKHPRTEQLVAKLTAAAQRIIDRRGRSLKHGEAAPPGLPWR